jgi:hypothetical protein
MTLPVQEPVFVIGRCAWATVRYAHLRPATTSNTEFTETTLHQPLFGKDRCKSDEL